MANFRYRCLFVCFLYICNNSSDPEPASVLHVSEAEGNQEGKAPYPCQASPGCSHQILTSAAGSCYELRQISTRAFVPDGKPYSYSCWIHLVSFSSGLPCGEYIKYDSPRSPFAVRRILSGQIGSNRQYLSFDFEGQESSIQEGKMRRCSLL